MLWLKKQNQFAKVGLALAKDADYGKWWGQVLEWRQEVIDVVKSLGTTERANY